MSRQSFTPWGELRSGGGDITQTTRDFTGQAKDGTGLLFYGARYYDPQRGQFTSADSIVPGSASGKGGAADTLGQDGKSALRPLTVDFHETAFSAGLAAENAFTQAKGFRFQLSDQDRQKAKADTGPGNPQALNRYSYVLNNPLRYTDPMGHGLIDETIKRAAEILNGIGIALSPLAISSLIVSIGFSALESCVFGSEDCRGALIGARDYYQKYYNRLPGAGELVSVIKGCFEPGRGCGASFTERGIPLSNHARFWLSQGRYDVTEAQLLEAYNNGYEVEGRGGGRCIYHPSSGIVIPVGSDAFTGQDLPYTYFRGDPSEC